MKKIICIIFLITLIVLSFTACSNIGINREIGFDTTWKFEYGIVQLGNGELIEGKVSSWRDFEDSDVVQFTMDGITYLTHYSNVILCSSKP